MGNQVRMWLLSEDANWESIAFCVRGRLVTHTEVSDDVWTELRVFLDEDHAPLSAVEGDVVVQHQSGEVEVYVRKDPSAYNVWLVAEEQRLAKEAYGE
jgi:hypothetical protein